MPWSLDDRKYLEKQYKDSTNLRRPVPACIRLSVNKYGWQSWVFDYFGLASSCRILELGCGPGTLWLTIFLAFLPVGRSSCRILRRGCWQLPDKTFRPTANFQYKVIDAQSIPIEDGYFDAVIANHMLYHVPNRPAALAEIRRVLKPAGRLYASTGGDQHLVEMAGLVGRFNHEVTSWGMDTNSFTLENGTPSFRPASQKLSSTTMKTAWR